MKKWTETLGIQHTHALSPFSGLTKVLSATGTRKKYFQDEIFTYAC